MDFAQLDLFARVASLGSLTKAAVVLDSTTSAISRQLTMLEKEWGGQLFHRTGRGVTLTELGKKVLPKVESLLLEARENLVLRLGVRRTFDVLRLVLPVV